MHPTCQWFTFYGEPVYACEMFSECPNGIVDNCAASTCYSGQANCTAQLVCDAPIYCSGTEVAQTYGVTVEECQNFCSANSDCVW